MKSAQGDKVADQRQTQMTQLTCSEEQLTQRQTEGEPTERVLVKALPTARK